MALPFTQNRARRDELSDLNSGQTERDLGEVLLAFYECLTDPARLELLMEILTSWLDDDAGAVVAPKLELHAERAWRLLGDIAETDGLPETADAAALLVTRYDTAEALDAAFADKIEPEDQAKLQDWTADKPQSGALLLRLIEAHSVELIVLSHDAKTGEFVAKRAGPEFDTLVSKFVADRFDLTHAEFALVRELLLGGTLREIADRLGKSWETIRSQIKSLTNKLGVRSQSDVLRMLNQAATLIPAQHQTDAGGPGRADRRLALPSGRTLTYEVDGAPSDRTLVYLHGMTQGRHWPAKAQALAASRGWRVVRISRAGRGPSSVNTKEGEALLQDHVDDVMAIVNHEGINSFSMFGAADGFSVGYRLALQHPERVQMIVGLEIIPPILSREVTAGFIGKMKTFGLSCLYAPKTIKFMFGLAMQRLEKMEDRHSSVHPLLGVVLSEHEDADGLRTDDLNHADLMVHKAEGMWRDATFAGYDWAFAPENSNLRPRAALIHSGNSLNKSPGHFDEFAVRIGAPILRIGHYLPYVSAALPTVLDALESMESRV